MAETSRFWTGRTSEGSPGDAGVYSASQMSQFIANGINHGMENANRGVMRGVLEELEVVPASPADTTVTVEPGSAFVQGIFYLNDADKSLNIASNASGSTRFDVVILEADYTAQTVRLDVVQGTPGAGLPSLTQSAGTIWQIPLAYLTLASGFTSIAASAITDIRNYANIPDAVGMPFVNASGATLEMGTVVYLFAGGNPPQAVPTASEGQQTILGVVESRVLNGATGRAITQGIFPVMCDELVAAAALLESSTTGGQAQAQVVGAPFARVLAANTGANTRCLAYINVPIRYVAPNYDSGWFAVTTATTYTKAHGLGLTPRHIELYHSAVAAPGAGDELVRVTHVSIDAGAPLYSSDVLGADATNVYAQTGVAGTGSGVVKSMRRNSDTGYYRILAWI